MTSIILLIFLVILSIILFIHTFSIAYQFLMRREPTKQLPAKVIRLNDQRLKKRKKKK